MPREDSAVLRLDTVELVPPKSIVGSRLQRELDVLLGVVFGLGTAAVFCIGLALALYVMLMYEGGEIAAALSTPLMTIVGVAIAAATMRLTISEENRVMVPSLFLISLVAYPFAWLARGWAQDSTFPSWGVERWTDWAIATRAGEIGTREIAGWTIPTGVWFAAEVVLAVAAGLAVAHVYVLRRERKRR